MSHAVTLNLPDNWLPSLERAARATRQPVEKLLLRAVQAALPTVEDVPPHLAPALEALELLTDDELRGVLCETVPPETQKRLSLLLRQQQTAPLPDAAQAELDALQHEADLVMLRKAQAAVLLRFRGQRLPTLHELARLTHTRA